LSRRRRGSEELDIALGFGRVYGDGVGVWEGLRREKRWIATVLKVRLVSSSLGLVWWGLVGIIPTKPQIPTHF
jgi:hypothetical protein